MIRALEKLGFTLKRQRGSHAFFHHIDGRCTIVPIHPGDLPRGIMRQILRDAGLNEDEFRKLL